jgi:hypothetical protein
MDAAIILLQACSSSATGAGFVTTGLIQAVVVAVDAIF